MDKTPHPCCLRRCDYRLRPGDVTSRKALARRRIGDACDMDDSIRSGQELRQTLRLIERPGDPDNAVPIRLRPPRERPRLPARLNRQPDQG